MCIVLSDMFQHVIACLYNIPNATLTPYIKLHVVGTRAKYCWWKALRFLLQNDVWGFSWTRRKSVFVPPALINAIEDHIHNLHTVSVAFPTNWYISLELIQSSKRRKKEKEKKTPTKNIKLRGGNLTPLFNSEAFWETVYVDNRNLYCTASASPL